MNTIILSFISAVVCINTQNFLLLSSFSFYDCILNCLSPHLWSFFLFFFFFTDITEICLIYNMCKFNVSDIMIWCICIYISKWPLCLLTDNCIVLFWGLLQVKLPWSFTYKSLYAHIFYFFLDESMEVDYIGVGI